MRSVRTRREVPVSEQVEPREAKAISEVGALALWHKELREGLRTRLTTDSLWLAAVHEAQGRDYLRLGMIDAANEARRQSARLVLDAALAAKAAC